MIAAILASGDLERLYAGLSLLVSAAADGRPARGLASFAALAPLLADDLEQRALDPAATPDLTPEGRVTFARSLVELRDTALELDGIELWACAAAVETTGADRDAVATRLAGIRSTPRFLRESAGADLVVL